MYMYSTAYMAKCLDFIHMYNNVHVTPCILNSPPEVLHLQFEEFDTNLVSKYNRRITPLTGMKFSGPAYGHARVKTKFSPQGETCLGTFGNCAGGVTPWGTVLTAEENIQAYYLGDARNTKEYESYKRFGLLGDKTAFSAWGKYHDHWNIKIN